MQNHMNSSKYKKLITDIFIFGVGALGSKFIVFFLLPLYTNILSDAEYGIADLVFTTGQLLVPIVSLAIFNGLLRYGLSPEYKKEEVWQCASIIFALGCVFTVILMPLFSLYKPISQWRWYLCLYTISYFASQNTFVYLKVKDRNKMYSILSILQALLLVLLNILFLAILGMGIRGYLLSSIISFIVTSVVAFWAGNMANGLCCYSFNKSLMKKMILYSLPFILNDISWWVIHSSDKIMIEWLLGSALLGIYTAASKIPSLINAVASIFTQAWGLSSIKEYDSTNDIHFYSRVFQCFSTAIFGVCICIIAVIKPFMSIYVGSGFSDSWRYVPLLLVSATFAAISSFAGSMYGAMKKSKNIMTTTLIAGIINVIINYIFIKMCGVWGAIIGTVTAYLVVAILRLLDVHRYIKIDYDVPKLMILTILTLTEAVLVSLNVNIILTCIFSLILYMILAHRDLGLLFQRVFYRGYKEK
jgi:O-antigen/teichoic acid export membrane protein